MVDVPEAAVEDDREDEQVDAHQQHGIRDRPEHAERRAAVLRLQVAAEEIAEELAVADQIRVRAHARASAAAPNCSKISSSETDTSHAG